MDKTIRNLLIALIIMIMALVVGVGIFGYYKYQEMKKIELQMKLEKIKMEQERIEAEKKRQEEEKKRAEEEARREKQEKINYYRKYVKNKMIELKNEENQIASMSLSMAEYHGMPVELYDNAVNELYNQLLNQLSEDKKEKLKINQKEWKKNIEIKVEKKMKKMNDDYKAEVGISMGSAGSGIESELYLEYYRERMYSIVEVWAKLL